jgi:P-type Cu+ transporter
MEVKAPVCGKTVEFRGSVDPIEHDGWAYFFCSPGCRRRFLADPDRYAARPLTPSRPARVAGRNHNRP